MNCAECRENLVACVEGLLDREESLQCQAHLETCAACRAEYTAITRLQRQLVARGQATAEVSLVEPVMRQVHREQFKPERETIISKLLKHRWGLGLGATATAAVIILIAFLSTPKIQAAAAEVMTKGAQAVARLASIHLHGQVRSAPAENFGDVNSTEDFTSIELWKQFEPELKWRIEKPGRVAAMDGQSTLLLVKPMNLAMKISHPASSAFDTGWLQKIADLSNTITNELKNALAKGWKLSLTEERGTDGRTKSVVTVEAKAGLPDNDYLKNKSFDTSDTRRVYRFDSQNGLLEAVQVYLAGKSGETLIFELNQIDYNQSIDPSVFQFELPANVNWYKEELPKLADNDKYANMTAQESARALFEACGREDWVEAGKFFPMPVPTLFRQYLGGLQLISVGEPFNSKGAGPSDVFVPYELKLKDGSVKQMNLHLRKDTQSGRWFYCGGI
ncbi:MAG: hypothetical protein ABSC89_09035 [Verrucomicrobiota bacterium]|jgi:outer membrane lipoprotein-sorting protein